MTDKKLMRIGKTGSSPKQKLLTPADILRHAEAIIRFDREVALRTQDALTDLVTPSQDHREGTPAAMSTLETLCGAGGAIKFKSDSAAPQNVVSFAARKKE